MKQVFVSAALLLAVALCCALALNRVENSVLEMIEQAEEMISAASNQDIEEASRSMQKLDEIWLREKDFFHILAGNQGCDHLEESMRRLKVWSAQKEKSPETLSELSNLILNAERLLRSQRPGMTNLL